MNSYVIIFIAVFLFVWLAVWMYEAVNPKCPDCNFPMSEDGYGKMECVNCDKDRLVREVISLRDRVDTTNKKKQVAKMLNKKFKKV